MEHRIWSVGKEKNVFDYIPGRNGAGGEVTCESGGGD